MTDDQFHKLLFEIRDLKVQIESLKLSMKQDLKHQFDQLREEMMAAASEIMVADGDINDDDIPEHIRKLLGK